MKTKHYLSAAVLALAFTACGDDYDDTALWNQVNDNTNRIEALETWQEQVNNNIAALQQLLNTTDYITSVTPVTKDGKEVGYTISFRNSDPITIYHGEKGDQGEQGEQGEQGIPGEPGKDGADGSDGSDGSTPQIGAEADGGTYYWTVNGEWLLDSEGKKIPLTGEDGKDAIAPQIRINETTNEWEISTDGGNTWTSTHVAATGEDGDTLIESIETADDGNSVTITLTGSDTPIVLPTWHWAESIEEEITELNGQLEAYAGLMQGKLLITAVEPTENGQTITYITVDADGKPSAPQSFTITNGKDGEKGESGATPTVEIDDNGNWIINGTDTGVPATGENGKTPEFTLDAEGNLSYQFEGETSVPLGNIKGPQGDKGEQGNQGNDGKDGVFTDIDYTQGDAKAVLTLADGTTIEVAIYQPLTIGEGTGTLMVAVGEPETIHLHFEGSYEAVVAQIIPEDDNIAIDTRADNGWKVTADLDAKTVTVTATNSGKALLDVSLIRSDGSKVTASRVLWAVSEVTGDKITAAGDYLLTGSRSSTLTIEGEGINLILDDAKVNVTNGNAITVSSGSPTITVVGTGNEVESSNGAGIFIAQGNTVTIEGNGTDDALTVKGSKGGAGIGGSAYTPCGDIIIDNITVTARSERQTGGGTYAAGIGTSSSSVGKISISNAIIYAYAAGDYLNMGAAAIGSGTDDSGGTTIQREFDITISNSTIYASKGCSYASYIGAGGETVNPTGYTIISTAKITNSTIYNESGAVITQ